PAFDNALSAFNMKMKIDLLNNPSETNGFMKVSNGRPYFRLTWVVPICRLGQTMSGRTYLCVLCYWLGVPLFFVSKPSSACSMVITRDIYGDHAVSCVGQTLRLSGYVALLVRRKA
nr:hypothetical protein [Tanacetum cinerariifolium]